MIDIDIEELCAWMRECGDVALRLFNRARAQRKSDNSPVTEADVAIERILVERVTARYPDHGIIGEEQTRFAMTQEYVWALDPIDGTASFVAGLPVWGISIGLLHRGIPYAGIFYMPLTDDCYWAIDNRAFLNHRPLSIHPTSEQEWESEDWLAIPSDAHRRLEIDFIGKTRSLGSAAAAICYVARGSALGAVLTHATIWDVAGSIAVLRAAGGVGITLAGAPFEPAAIIDGRAVREPLLFGAPGTVEALRRHIRVRC
ncbi:MAG: inositol-phosphate phosphatase [Roseiflexus castenholzii]|uniref:inositol monophosphatase family protein n=1 Tax=Roseiflexus castenholzii TaxID=120962 RepID=UPI000CB74490|nr:MAG: inositol-phosphate phosphatase [Roseiflexus castenholzii]